MSGLTAEQAARYIRSGRPFIVTDMVQDWGMRSWDCDSVGRDFPREQMQLWNFYDSDDGQKEMPRDVRLSEPWQEWLYPQQHSADAADGVRSNGSCTDGPPRALSFHWYTLPWHQRRHRRARGWTQVSTG